MSYFPPVRLLLSLLGVVGVVCSGWAQFAGTDAVRLRTQLQTHREDTSRVRLLLELGQFYIIKSGELASDLDTALLLGRQASALSNALRYRRGQGASHLILAQAYREKGDKQQGRQLTQRAIDLLTRFGSLEDQADAYAELANYYTVTKEGLREKIRLYDRIIPLLQRAGNTLKLADAFRYRGDLYQLNSNNVGALRDLRRALTLYQSISYPRLQEVYDLLGFVSSKMGDYESGVKYGLRAMQQAEAFKDSVKLAKLYSRLGITYKELDQPEKAIFYFNKSLRIGQTQRRRTTIIHLSTTISAIIEAFDQSDQVAERLKLEEALAHLQTVVKSRPNNSDDIDCRMAVASCMVNYYGRLRQSYKEAEPYRNQLEQMLLTNLGSDYRLYIHGVLIPFYVQSRQYRKAEALLDANQKICYQTSYMKELSVNHLWWFKLDSALARYPGAIRHYQRYKTLTDSLLTVSKNQRIEQLEVQYQTQEKEHRIHRLTQQSKLQQLRLKEAETSRNFIVSGATMLLLLLGLGYNRYRLKQRSNQQLQAQQLRLQAQHEELQAQQEVLQAQQLEIHRKNEYLSELLGEKDSLLGQKDQLLAEKEWLLKEIHHRVKNNLQIVMSLLNSQSASLEDKTALAAIRESQHRVHAMALIHQTLYQSEGLARINMKSYIEDVMFYLRDCYHSYQPIGFTLEVEPIELDVTLAVPLGLIINEAITNSFKYAFPNGRAGTLCLRFTRLEPGTYQLVVADDGVGLPAGYNPARSRSLGLTLMHGFSGQLGGELIITSPPGMHISLVFSEPPSSAPVVRAAPQKAASIA